VIRALSLAAALTVTLVPAGTTERVSVTAAGEQADAESWGDAMSADGRYVLFDSHGPNLVPGDTNGQTDVFVRDLQTGETTRVDVASDGKQARALPSHGTSISADGRYAVFTSEAANLVPDDTNEATDVFVHDLQTGATTRVSVASSNAQAVGFSGDGAISADGRYVAFASYARNLVRRDTNGAEDVFLRDLQAGKTTRLDLSSFGRQTSRGSQTASPAISADGRYVAFQSNATNLVTGDTNRVTDIFLRDRKRGLTVRVSVGPRGRQARDPRSRNGSVEPSISADGRFVAFVSTAANLVSHDTNRRPDVFVRDRGRRRTMRASVSSSGRQAKLESGVPVLSPDGRFVAFSSYSALVPGEAAGVGQVFVRDLRAGTVALASSSSDGEAGDDSSTAAGFSADGRYLAFSSWARNLVPGDTNGQLDVFVHDFGQCASCSR
jgi:Tol biopolymer transport system component